MQERRIIGDSPPRYGGKKAFSTVQPCHEGLCDLLYETEGNERIARFVNYQVARTAAIQAIFSIEAEINNVCVTAAMAKDSTVQIYQSAKTWFSHHKSSLSTN